MNSLLLRLAYIRTVAIGLGVLVPLLMVQRGMSASEFSTYRALEFAPYIVLGLVVGAAVDARGPRLLGRWATYAHLLPPLIALAVTFELLAAPALYVVLITLVAASYIASLAISKAAAEVVDAAALAKFNARSMLIEKTAALLLPLGITWVAEQSLALAMSLIATFSLSVLALPRRDGMPDHGAAASSGWLAGVASRTVAGLKSMLANPPLFRLCLMVTAVNAIEAVPGAFVVLYATRDLSLSYVQIGQIVTAAGAGGIAAALLAERLRNIPRALWIVLTASVLFNGCLYFAVFFWQTFECLLVTRLLESASFVFSAVAFRTLRQSLADQESYGVALGVSGAMIKLGIPPAILLAGWLAESVGMRHLYLYTGIAEFVLAAVIVLLFTSRRSSR
jgi:hypothetical protein